MLTGFINRIFPKPEESNVHIFQKTQEDERESKNLIEVNLQSVGETLTNLDCMKKLGYESEIESNFRLLGGKRYIFKFELEQGDYICTDPLDRLKSACETCNVQIYKIGDLKKIKFPKDNV